MSSISSLGGISNLMMQGIWQHANSAKMAENLFSKLDTSGQGYVQKADIQSALDSISSGTSSSSSSSNVDDFFGTLDSNSDGKVTLQELSDTLTNVMSQMEQQFQITRTQASVSSGSIDGTKNLANTLSPQQGTDQGLSKETLANQLQEIGSSDSNRYERNLALLNNFDSADTNGDGMISHSEAHAFNETNNIPTTSTDTSSASVSDTSLTSGSSLNDNGFQQMVKLMQVYGLSDDDTNANAVTLSVTA